ncbi:MAG: tetratricopeptide repeat protein [Candidatus Sulfotelmatobacter sp.]
MRPRAIGFGVAAWLAAFPGSLYAQSKTACELLSQADAEAVLKVRLQPPNPYAPFRSLLDPDFTKGKLAQGCTFTNAAPHPPRPAKVVAVHVEVRYSPTPDAHAVDEARQQVDERTRDNPTDVPNLGDAAFWIGPPDNVSLFVFRGGTMRLLIDSTGVGLEQEKALAARILAASGKTGYAYGARPTGFNKPVLVSLGANPSQVDQLKHSLSPKAEAGNVKAQLALGQLYLSGTLGADGNTKPDYAGAAYWYQKASDDGDVHAEYELAVIYRDGLGVPENPSAALELFKKSALAGYMPAMVPLSYAYAATRSSLSLERATYWATKASEAGDPRGWLILGYEYNKGLLGGERPYWYQMAMDAYKKSAAGGDCVAMLNIGGLYFNGDGVPQDKTQAQSWFAKAQACRGKEFDWVWQKAATYKQRAAAGHLPAVAVPIPPAKGAVGFSPGEKIVMGIAAFVAVAIAIDALFPQTEKDKDSSPAPDITAIIQQSQNDMAAKEFQQQQLQKILAPNPPVRE